MTDFKDRIIPAGAWWSPLAKGDQPLAVDAISRHPRFLFDPSAVLTDLPPLAEDAEQSLCGKKLSEPEAPS